MKTILSSRRANYLTRISIFLITVALIAVMVGCGTTTVEIRDWHDLDAIRNNLGRSYILMNDLDSTIAGYTELASPTANQGKGWQPIGSSDPYDPQQFKPFTGSFDGQGHVIRDLFINRSDEYCVGLFSWVGERGVIKDLGVVNATVTGGEAVAHLVGESDGTITNSYSTGSVTGNSYIGGLVGRNDGTASSSYSTDSVAGNKRAGGLVGVNYGTVSNSYSTGSVSGNEDVGGLVGYSEGTVSNSFWDIETSGQTTSAGGTGKTTAEMNSIATFSEAGWNISAVADLGTRNLAYIWNIVNEVTYPFLSWQPV